jgi:MerR family transcriptional regulator, light-induced transcriptional regulator
MHQITLCQLFVQDVYMTTQFNIQDMLPISIVERETGLSKDVLRIWERRYGFPEPSRDAAGDRLYPRNQINRLRLIKRLIDSGLRPGKVIPQTEQQLQALAQAYAKPLLQSVPHDLDRYMRLIKKHEADELRRLFNLQLIRLGLPKFVTDIVEPLNVQIGEAWMRGELAIFEEHLYTEILISSLRVAINSLSAEACPPKVLLTTFPNELHSLGLLMVESLLAGDSAECISMGTQMPVSEIAASAIAHRADIVALTFSGAYPAQMIGKGLKELKDLLPAHVVIWAGGAAVTETRLRIDGVMFARTLSDVPKFLLSWRSKYTVRQASEEIHGQQMDESSRSVA